MEPNNKCITINEQLTKGARKDVTVSHTTKDKARIGREGGNVVFVEATVSKLSQAHGNDKMGESL